MKQEKRIAVISSDSRITAELKDVLHQELARTEDDDVRVKVYAQVPSVEEAVIHYAPHFIFVHLEEGSNELRLVFLDHLSRIAARIPVIVISSNLDSDLMLTCLKKGVRDFVKPPIQAAEIREMLSRLIREFPIVGGEDKRGMTSVFFSYKGGIGTTFLACNTAVALAQHTHARVLLWDMVLQNGDVPFFFDHEPSVTLTDLLEHTGQLEESYIRSSLPVQPSGVSILAGPKRPEESEGIRSDQIQNLHKLLRKHFDYIVIDAGHSLTDHVISTMDDARYILLTTDLHLPVLKNTLRCLEVFERLGYVEGKFRIILNRYNSKYEKFDLEKAQDILGYPVAFTMANDYFTVSRSLNTGIPVSELDANSVLAKQFETLARLLINDFTLEEQRSLTLMEKAQGLLAKMKAPKKKPKKEAAEEPPPSAKEEPNAAKRSA